MNILITSASRKVSLIRAFQEALAHEGGGKVEAADIDPTAPALYFADDWSLVPPTSNPEFLETMLRVCDTKGIRLLIPTRDEELLFFSQHRHDFEDAGTIVMVSEPGSINVCQDKKLFLQFCEDNGFATPRTYEREHVPESVEFPLFMKPRFGKGGFQATRVNSREELELTTRHMPDVIIQEFMQLPEYTVDLFADFSGRIISVVPRERIRVLGGESFVGKTSKNWKLINESIRIAARLCLVGHNTIQCFLDNADVRFIEVNPRFGGGANLGFAAGARTPQYLVRLLKGETVESRIGDFKDNYFMLRYTEDLFLENDSLMDRIVT